MPHYLQTSYHTPRPPVRDAARSALRVFGLLCLLGFLFALGSGFASAEETPTAVPFEPTPPAKNELTPTPTAQVPTQTSVPTYSATPVPTQTSTPVSTATTTQTATATVTQTPTFAQYFTASATPSPAYESTPTATHTEVVTPTATDITLGIIVATVVPQSQGTHTPVNIVHTPTVTATAISTFTATATTTPTGGTATPIGTWAPPAPDCDPKPGPVVLKLDVPYIHQVLDIGGADGNWACGPTSVAMVLAYYGKLLPWPEYVAERQNAEPAPGTKIAQERVVPAATASKTPIKRGETNIKPTRSLYAPYITNVFTEAGHTYSTASSDPRGNRVSGLYGTICPSGLADWGKIAAVLQWNGLSSTQISTGFDGIVAALKRGHPVIVGNKLTPQGHVLVAIGYTANGHLIVNDPYGNRFQPGYGGTSGKGVAYLLRCMTARNALEVIGTYPPPPRPTPAQLQRSVEEVSSGTIYSVRQASGKFGEDSRDYQTSDPAPSLLGTGDQLFHSSSLSLEPFAPADRRAGTGSSQSAPRQAQGSKGVSSAGGAATWWVWAVLPLLVGTVGTAFLRRARKPVPATAPLTEAGAVAETPQDSSEEEAADHGEVSPEQADGER